METVARNAEQALTQHKITRGRRPDHPQPGARRRCQEALGLDEAPLRIECFDVSHLQGTDVVASMVVFEDGLPRKSEYRRFIIRGRRDRGRADDTAAIARGASRRRFRRGQRRRTGRDR